MYLSIIMLRFALLVVAGMSEADVLDNGEGNDKGKNTSVQCSFLPTIEEFEILKPISRGAYGKVYLGYKRKNPNKLYAIKVNIFSGHSVLVESQFPRHHWLCFQMATFLHVLGDEEKRNGQ